MKSTLSPEYSKEKDELAKLIKTTRNPAHNMVMTKTGLKEFFSTIFLYLNPGISIEVQC